MSEQERCGNCRFWQKIECGETGDGECRRYPPLPLQDSGTVERWYDHSSGFVFPKIHLADWCGEWQPVKEEPKDA